MKVVSSKSSIRCARLFLKRSDFEPRRIIAEQEQLLATAQARVQEVLSERGLLAAVEAERERLLQQAEHEAAEIRAGADAYARQVLEELDERLSKLLSSVRNGLHALEERRTSA
jgi:regulator of protease activity HflC (stomatin/prohibitin superfamily)